MWDFLLMLRPSALLGSSQSQHPLMYLGCLEEKYDRHLFVTQTAVVAMKNMRMTTVKTFSVDPEHQGSRRRAPGGVQILLCRGAGEPSPLWYFEREGPEHRTLQETDQEVRAVAPRHGQRRSTYGPDL